MPCDYESTGVKQCKLKAGDGSAPEDALEAFLAEDLCVGLEDTAVSASELEALLLRKGQSGVIDLPDGDQLEGVGEEAGHEAGSASDHGLLPVIEVICD